MAASALMFNNIPQPNAPHPMAGTSANGSTSATDTGAGITANDFLTLLVTEMKNQDPTSAQDPNQYVNQLVGVNSLQQLIQINETLQGALWTPAPKAEPEIPTQSSGSLPVNLPTVQPQPIQQPSPLITHGNLSIPATSSAAHRVASALSHSTARL
jgi:flagellar basal-body rod modification protein FlgD